MSVHGGVGALPPCVNRSLSFSMDTRMDTTWIHSLYYQYTATFNNLLITILNKI